MDCHVAVPSIETKIHSVMFTHSKCYSAELLLRVGLMCWVDAQILDVFMQCV